MLQKHSKFLAALLVSSTLLAAGTATAQAAFARVDANGNVLTFGGLNALSATVAHSAGTGYYEVTFNGLFGVSGPNSVVVNSTAESLQYGVSNNYVVSATTSQITVGVFTWVSNNLVTVDNPFYVTVNTGRM